MTAQPGRSGFSPLLLVGLALLLVALGLNAIASSLPRAAARRVGPNAAINAEAKSKKFLAAHNSPSLAHNPTDEKNLVVANRIDTPQFSCALHASHDGGATWADVKVPFPAGEELPERCFAPDVAFDSAGVLYVSYVTLKGGGNVPNALWMVSSSDGGRTVSTPSRVLGPLAFQVRLAADPSTPRRLYLSWLQAGATVSLGYTNTGNPVNFSRSDDGGATWSEPVAITPPARIRPISPTLEVGRDGELYVLYVDLVDDALDYHGSHQGKGGPPYAEPWQLVLARSSDGGRRWRETVVEDKLVPTQRFIVFLAPSPSLAVAPGGDVFAAFHDGRLGDPDVWLWTSRDGGASFAPPLRVNENRKGDGSSQYLPKVALSRNGRLDVIYYDRRSDPDDVMNEVSLQTSFQPGSGFLPRVTLSDRAFDSRIGFGSERDMPDLGSKLALVSGEERALAVWTDTRGGNDVATKQDLARAVVAFTEGSPRRTPLRWLAVGILAAGLLVLGRTAISGRGRKELLKIS